MQIQQFYKYHRHTEYAHTYISACIRAIKNNNNMF